ncbi:MAG: ATP-binding protein, partial [Chloroflexota bacterium]|nr:ATP-binding protein [Chloroflexota bacterium]
ESRGLAAAMEQYLAGMREGDKRTRYHLVLRDDVQNHHLALSASRMIFAVLQEAVNNARKHAQADNIWVTLQHAEGTGQRILEAAVRDDGVGFDLEQAEAAYDERYSFGLANMKERAQLIDANLHLKSDGGGTTVCLAVPL